MIRKTNGYLEAYYKGSLDGTYVLGYTLKQELANLMEDMEGDDFIYDTTDADRRIAFMEGCIRLTKSPWYGVRLTLQPFQKAFISAFYGFKMKDGHDRFKKALLLCGRKNSKTETTSALAITEFILGGSGMDIVVASNDDNQADLLYQACDAMRQQLDPQSKDTWRNQKGLRCLINNNRIFKMSNKIRNMDGRNVDSCCLDELHQEMENKLLKAIEQSQSTKENPKLIMISTDGFCTGGTLDIELDKCYKIINKQAFDEASVRYLPWLYQMDSEDEVWNGNRENRLWEKANPMLGIVKKWEYLEEQVALAKQYTQDRVYVLTKDFNIHQNTASAWLLSESYSYNYQPFNPEEFRGAVAIGGVDLAETTDLCSAKVILRRPNDVNKYILSMYWIPETKLDPKNDDSQVGAKYKEWQKDDMMRVDSGNYVNTTLVADWFYELWNKYRIRLYKCGYDVRFSQEFTDRMDDYGFDYEMVYQRPEVMSLPNKMVETDLKHQEIIGLNTVDRWCLSNCALKLDSKGFGLVVKIDPSRRIDGAVSLIIAYEIYRRHIDEIERTLK